MKKTLAVVLATTLVLTFPLGGFAVGEEEAPETMSFESWGTVPLGASPSELAAASEDSRLEVVRAEDVYASNSAMDTADLMSGDAERPTHVEGQVLVSVADSSAIQSLAGVAGVAKIQSGRLGTSTVPEGNTVVVELDEGTSVAAAVSSLAGVSGVVHAQPNYLYYPTGSVHIPNDTYFPELWGLHNTGTTGTADADIDAPEAWGTEKGSDRTIVAVIDSGIDPGHPDLVENLWTNRREIRGNGKDDDGNGYIDDIHGYDVVKGSGVLYDIVGHGTHVAGTIGAQGNNSFGVTGVSQDVAIMTLKADGDIGGFTTDALLKSIAYIDKMDAEIVNMSLGGYATDPLVRDAIAASSALFVCAAGNDANNNDSNPAYPASYPLPNIIAVAASDSDDQLAGFSNYGATSVDLAAPGEGILSTVFRPDTLARWSDDFDYLGAWDASNYWQKPWALSDSQSISARTSLAQASPKPTEWAWATLKNPVDVKGSTRPSVWFWINSAAVSGEDYVYLWIGLDNGFGVTEKIDTEGTGWERRGVVIPSFPADSKLHIAFVYASNTSRSSAPGAVFVDDVAVYESMDEEWLPWAFADGTSMAAPHVAGVAGLIKSRNPDKSTAEIKAILMGSVDTLTSLSGKVATGGRLNAQKAIAATPKTESAKVKRIAGSSRFAVSAELAREVYYKDDGSWAGDTDVIIASGDDAAAADPLSAAGLAWARNAPLLLVGKDHSPSSVEQVLYEIAKENGKVDLHIVGGPNSVPHSRVKDVVARAKSIGTVSVKSRYGTGTDRFGVAAEVAQSVRAEWQTRHGTEPPVVLAANGADPATFFDALALSAIASKKGYPIALLYSDKIPSKTSSVISSIKPDRVIVSGGYRTVSPEVLAKLDGMATSGAERWAGATRYDTAVSIADNSIDEGWLHDDSAMVAAKLPDALTGGSMLGRSGTPLLVTTTNTLVEPADLWMIDYSLTVDTCYILGGTASVKPEVESRIKSLLR